MTKFYYASFAKQTYDDQGICKSVEILSGLCLQNPIVFAYHNNIVLVSSKELTQDDLHEPLIQKLLQDQLAIEQEKNNEQKASGLQSSTKQDSEERGDKQSVSGSDISEQQSQSEQVS